MRGFGRTPVLPEATLVGPLGTLSAQLMRQGRDWLCQPNGLAGIYETSAIQGRLQAGLSVDYGLTGFLVAWLSGQHFLRAVPIAILIGGLIAAGDADRKWQASTTGSPYLINGPTILDTTVANLEGLDLNGFSN
jgi:hypothetical protein